MLRHTASVCECVCERERARVRERVSERERAQEATRVIRGGQNHAEADGARAAANRAKS